MLADSHVPPTHSVRESSEYFKQWRRQARNAYETEWFNLLEKNTYFAIEYKTPQIIILPIVDNNNILMVKAKRPVLGSSTWELPAGASEEGESMREGASRELLEETGIKIMQLGRFRELPTLIVSPNRMPMFPHVFQVDVSMAEYQTRLDHDEEIEKISLFSFPEIKNMIILGDIFISLPISIISRYLFSI